MVTFRQPTSASVRFDFLPLQLRLRLQNPFVPLLLGAVLCMALSGCSAHGFAYYLFKPLWTKPLPHDVALGFSTPYLVMMEGDPSAWKYMNEVEDRGMALAFEAEFKALWEHERQLGRVDGEHSIVVEATVERNHPDELPRRDALSPDLASPHRLHLPRSRHE